MPSPQDIPSLNAAIQFQARLTPHAVAIVTQERDYSYRTLARDIERVTRRLHAHGIAEGTRVGLKFRSPYMRWLVTIALARMGLVSITIGDPQRELGWVRAGLFVTDKSDAGLPCETLEAPRAWLEEDDAHLTQFQDRRFARETPCHMVLSSGTTGVPKKAMLTYGDIADRMYGNARTYGLNATARLLTTMAPTTIGGFMTYAACLASGGAAVMLDLVAGMPLERLLALQPNVLFTSTAQLEGLMKTLPADYWPSRHLYVYVAGSLVSARLSREVRSRLSQSLFILYGSTEAGTITLAHGLRAEQQPGFIGFPLPWADVQLLGDDGAPVAPGTPGELRIRTPGMVTRYEDEAEGADAAFKDGWFYPGDLGHFTPDGGVVILGRTREVMNFGGSKWAPDVLEEAVADLPGMKEFAAFSLGDGHPRPWMAVVAAEGFDEKALKKQFARAFPNLPPLGLAYIDAIPRNEMGKVKRGELRARVERKLEGAPT
jgi:acyl-coenzyme A synthetase/AMP-(fatty) acid ligase